MAEADDNVYERLQLDMAAHVAAEDDRRAREEALQRQTNSAHRRMVGAAFGGARGRNMRRTDQRATA